MPCGKKPPKNSLPPGVYPGPNYSEGNLEMIIDRNILRRELGKNLSDIEAEIKVANQHPRAEQTIAILLGAKAETLHALTLLNGEGR